MNFDEFPTSGFDEKPLGGGTKGGYNLDNLEALE